jgi:hypothetical protein
VTSEFKVIRSRVILAPQEEEIRRIMFPSQHRQIVCKTLSQNQLSQKKKKLVGKWFIV